MSVLNTEKRVRCDMTYYMIEGVSFTHQRLHLWERKIRMDMLICRSLVWISMRNIRINSCPTSGKASIFV